MFSAVARIFRTPDLRKKIGFTLGIIAIFLGIAFKELNVSYLVGWAFSVAASATAVAPDFAHEVAYPVVAKVRSPDIAHKTEAGGVLLNTESLIKSAEPGVRLGLILFADQGSDIEFGYLGLEKFGVSPSAFLPFGPALRRCRAPEALETPNPCFCLLYFRLLCFPSC